jgi:arylmalonate decarboxylase
LYNATVYKSYLKGLNIPFISRHGISYHHLLQSLFIGEKFVMKISRRAFNQLFATGALATFGLQQGFAQTKRRLGLIFPVIDRGVPEEGLSLYGDQVEFIINNVDLKTMTPEGYDAVIADIPEKAIALANQGVEAIMVMGTSLTFYQGQEFNQRVQDTIQDVTGLPASTMSNAIIHGLQEVGANKVVCATAYNDVVNNRLVRFLGQHDFSVTHIQGLGIEAVEDILAVTDPQLIEFCSNVAAQADDSDAILISCGGLITLNILEPVEGRTQLPAVSSTPHALYEGAKLLGIDPKVPGYGKLLAG